MRRVTCTLCLHDGDALIDLLIGQIQSELTAQHVVIVAILFEPTLVGSSYRITHGDSRVIHSDPRPIGPWLRNDDVALVRSIGVRAGIPVHDLVFTVVSRVRNDSVNVLPTVLEPRL